MAYKYNPLEDAFNIIGKIPQYSSDPSSPVPQDAWVLKSSVGGTAIQPGLLLLALSPNTSASTSYSLKYRTQEGNTLSIALT